MKLRKLSKNNDAVLGYFLAFVFSAVMLVFLFSFAIPFLISFTTDMYIASEDIILDNQDKIASINNATVRAQIQSNLNNMQGAVQENIDYLSFFYQFGWVFVILVVVFTILILARKTVETQGFNGAI